MTPSRALVASLVVFAAALMLVTGAARATHAAVAGCGESYVVEGGDSLSAIAVEFDTTVEAILACNPQIADPDGILISQVLLLPGGAPARAVTIHDVVDKAHALPPEYAPVGVVGVRPDLVALGNPLLRGDAHHLLVQMLNAAASDGHTIKVTSAYRSFDEQLETFQHFVNSLGQAEAGRVSARPGKSEHQLGTTVDISGAEVNHQAVEEFGATAAGQWLSEHAHEYGFALSYPADGEPTTGYAYEPWHWRYIGTPHAALWRDSSLFLNQFLGRLVLWGDADCDGAVTAADVVSTLALSAALNSGSPRCPSPGSPVPSLVGERLWGDVECGGLITGYDGLALLLSLGGFDPVLSADCPAVGDRVAVLYGPP